MSFWLISFGMMLSSCTKNDENTIILIGTEYYIDNILSVIPDTLQPRFLAEFGSIPSGVVPPKVEGSYVMNPKQRLNSNVPSWPLSATEPPMYLRFTKQHNGISILDLNEATENVTDTIFVQGSGSNFTAYFIENKAYDMDFNEQTYHVSLRRGVIMKGQVTETGLADFRYATIIMNIEDNSNGIVEQYDKGSYFIYKDGDGKAERFEW